MSDAFGGGFAIFRFEATANAMVDRLADVPEKVNFCDLHDHSPVIALNSEIEGFIENV